MSEPVQDTVGQPARVLVVDDDPVARRLLLELLRHAGCSVETAVGGEEAWRLLCEPSSDFDVVLLDWMMPGMSGLELLAAIKENERLRTIPVILQTGRCDRRDVVQGITAGAYYYVTKPFDTEMVLSMVKTAASDHAAQRAAREALHRGLDAIGSVQQASFRFKSANQGKGLATLLSMAFPDPERAVTGLHELLLNAVEHGNLGITYEEKTDLLAQGRWLAEVEQRLDLPEHACKVVEVTLERGETDVRVTIVDEGAGFDWQSYLRISPERVFDTHGRGIAMANLLSFDELTYHPPGNRVTAVVRL